MITKLRPNTGAGNSVAVTAPRNDVTCPASAADNKGGSQHPVIARLRHSALRAVAIRQLHPAILAMVTSCPEKAGSRVARSRHCRRSAGGSLAEFLKTG
jgi:hypothetical protein